MIHHCMIIIIQVILKPTEVPPIHKWPEVIINNKNNNYNAQIVQGSHIRKQSNSKAMFITIMSYY